MLPNAQGLVCKAEYKIGAEDDEREAATWVEPGAMCAAGVVAAPSLGRQEALPPPPLDAALLRHATPCVGVFFYFPSNVSVLASSAPHPTPPAHQWATGREVPHPPPAPHMRPRLADGRRPRAPTPSYF